MSAEQEFTVDTRDFTLGYVASNASGRPTVYHDYERGETITYDEFFTYRLKGRDGKILDIESFVMGDDRLLWIVYCEQDQ